MNAATQPGIRAPEPGGESRLLYSVREVRHSIRRSLIACVLICLAQAFAARGETWTDALGRRVELRRPPERIVSLVPSITETLFALGAGDRLVGVTEFCDYPPAARGKPRVGSYADPGLEAMVAMAPDLVLAAADQTKPALVDRLDDLGIAAFVVYPRTFSETIETIATISAVIGDAAAGQELARTMAEEATQVRQAVTGRDRPRVLLCVMVQPLVVAGVGTLGDDLIRMAGGVNVVEGGATRYPTWGPEAVLAADPEVLVITTMTESDSPAAYFQKWPELAAVAADRVHQVPGDWVHRSGPRLTRGLKALARALHPGSVPEPEPPLPHAEGAKP